MYVRSLVLFVFLLYCKTSFAIVTVGSSPGAGSCDYSTIGAALASGDSEVRVLAGTFSEDLTIDDTVRVIGGFDSCNDADQNNPGSSLTLVNGSGTASVVSIQSTSNVTVRLANLWIQGGNNSDGGGISAVMSGQLTLDNVLLLSNLATRGGGLFASQTGTFLQINMLESDIIGNTAGQSGGGVFCQGLTSVWVDVGSSIANNGAINGGGAFVDGNCGLSVYAGVNPSLSAANVGVMSNHASGSGGGVFAQNMGQVFILGGTDISGNFGDPTAPASVSRNTAGGSGGGIYATDFGTQVYISDAMLWMNDAGASGGAVAVVNDAQLVTVNSGGQCWSSEYCTDFGSNTANLGGAVYASSGAFASVFQTGLANNRANFGTAIYVRDSDTTLKVEGSVFFDNGDDGNSGWNDQYVIRAYGGFAELLHVTVGTNKVVNASLGASSLGGATTMNVYNSIVFNPGYEVVTYSGSPNSDNACVIVNEAGQMSGADIWSYDPSFIGPSFGDYRLQGGSEAIDVCADRSADHADYENQPRGWDDPAWPNTGGSFDAGADESYLNDIILNNGFGR